MENDTVGYKTVSNGYKGIYEYKDECIITIFIKKSSFFFKTPSFDNFPLNYAEIIM